METVRVRIGYRPAYEVVTGSKAADVKQGQGRNLSTGLGHKKQGERRYSVRGEAELMAAEAVPEVFTRLKLALEMLSKQHGVSWRPVLLDAPADEELFSFYPTIHRWSRYHMYRRRAFVVEIRYRSKYTYIVETERFAGEQFRMLVRKSGGRLAVADLEKLLRKGVEPGGVWKRNSIFTSPPYQLIFHRTLFPNRFAEYILSIF